MLILQEHCSTCAIKNVIRCLYEWWYRWQQTYLLERTWELFRDFLNLDHNFSSFSASKCKQLTRDRKALSSSSSPSTHCSAFTTWSPISSHDVLLPIGNFASLVSSSDPDIHVVYLIQLASAQQVTCLCPKREKDSKNNFLAKLVFWVEKNLRKLTSLISTEKELFVCIVPVTTVCHYQKGRFVDFGGTDGF